MNVIVELVAERLRTEGVVVDILPATVPPKYQADAFVSIHADGNPNSDVRGFKIAGPRRDYSGLASVLVSALYEEYDAVTDLPQDANISRRMTAYYAFNWARYEHAVHPYTPAAIVETGFLTNPADRELIVNQPEVAAEGIANGILTFLATERTPEPPPQEFYQPTLPLTGQVECAQVRAERRDRDDGTCFPSVRTQDGRNYIIVDGELATSTLESEPYRATVSGTYRPVQTLENYFWFNFEVVGLIFEPTVNRFEEGSE